MRTLHLLDQIGIEILVPRTLTGRQVAAVRRLLVRTSFLPEVRAALLPLFTSHAALRVVRLRVGR